MHETISQVPWSIAFKSAKAGSRKQEGATRRTTSELGCCYTSAAVSIYKRRREFSNLYVPGRQHKIHMYQITHNGICNEWLRLYRGLSRFESREKYFKEVSREEWSRCEISWDTQVVENTVVDEVELDALDGGIVVVLACGFACTSRHVARKATSSTPAGMNSDG